VFGRTGLAVWTRQLAGLVGSGLPLERALTALADEAEDAAAARAGGGTCAARSTPAAASPVRWAGAPREFDEVYRAVVAAGEQSGAPGPGAGAPGRRPGAAQALRAKLLGAAVPGHRVG
jgi:general secretion pathway protein F